MANDILQLREESGVLTITLNRPEVFNSFNAELARAFLDAIQSANNAQSIRAVLITGSGKAFSAGQDLPELITPDSKGNLPDIAAIIERFNNIARAMRNLPKPIVCAVNGAAAGAGSSIALAADFVVAAESSYFMQSFVHVGLIPDTGATYHLPRLLGMAKANELIMLGEKLSAKDALALGLIYRMYADSVFLAEARKLAEHLATLPTLGLGMSKLAINRSWENNFQQQLELEKELQIRASRSSDYEEGVKAFVEKRKPIFRGQ